MHVSLIGHDVERIRGLGQEVNTSHPLCSSAGHSISQVVKELDGKVISAGQLGDEKQESKM